MTTLNSRLSKEPLKEGECKNCGDLFYVTHHAEKYCTEICMEEYIRRMYKNRPASEETGRFKIFMRDGFKCVYCGKTAEDDVKLSIDHVVPLSKNGENDVFNLMTCCNICNSLKHGTLLSKNQILKYWERNMSLDQVSGLVETYDELKREFDILFSQRMNKKIKR